MSVCAFRSFWHAIHLANAQTILRTPEMSIARSFGVQSILVAPLSGLVWIDAGWQALHWVTWMVLSRGIQWEGRWKVTWFWYLIHNDLPSKSLNHHSSSVCCLLSHLSLHFSTALNPFLQKKKRLWRWKSNYNRPAAFVESGPPFFAVDSVCFVVID